MENVLNRWKNSLAPKGSARFFQVFPWVWLIAAYCITFAVLTLYGRPYIDSDMSSEMILADLLNQEGKIVTANWWYSTEVRVFCLQLLYKVGLILFPQNWYAAQMFGQAIGTFILIVSYLYVGHGLHLKNCGAWSAIALVCPFSVCYIWYCLLGGYYLPHMICLLAGVGAILHMLQTKLQVRFWIHGVLLLTSSLLFGLNGLKGFMGFYIPLVLASIIALWLQWNAKPNEFPRAEGRLVILSLTALATAGIGYLFYDRVIFPNVVVADYTNRIWNKFSWNRLLQKLVDFLSLFGYPIDASVGGSVPLFSVEGVLCSFGLVVAGAIVFSLFRLLVRWRELDPIQRLVPLLLASVCVFQGGIFAWTGDLNDTSPYHWLTIVPLAFSVLQLEGETEHLHIPNIRRVAALSFCVCIVIVSIGSTHRYFTSGFRVKPHLEEVCDWLVESGYTQGYSSFWNGNVLTEWSNGKIEMWVCASFSTMEATQWLQKASHKEPPKGEIFLLTTIEELERKDLSNLYWWSNVVYEDKEEHVGNEEHYLIMVYDSYDDMMNAIGGARANAE